MIEQNFGIHSLRRSSATWLSIEGHYSFRESPGSLKENLLVTFTNHSPGAEEVPWLSRRQVEIHTSIDSVSLHLYAGAGESSRRCFTSEK